MSLKCPICGREYFYDAKVCQDCENYSIESNLINCGPNKGYKWNCNYFFNDKRGIFSICNSIRRQIKLMPEPKDMRITIPLFYEWNCDSSNRFDINSISFDSKVEKKRRIPLVYVELDLDGGRESSHLVYE